MNNKTKEKIYKLVLSALLAAICFVVTYFIPPVPLPNGYANLGDTIVLLSAFIVGGLWGAAAAGLGSCLADLFFSSFVFYAPATFIIKALMAFIAFLIFKKVKASKKRSTAILFTFLGCICAELIMTAGYFVFELFLYKGGAFASVPGNLLQGAANTVLATVIIAFINENKTLKKYF